MPLQCRWVDEKGHTRCEICNEQYQGDYEAPPPPAPDMADHVSLFARESHRLVHVLFVHLYLACCTLLAHGSTSIGLCSYWLHPARIQVHTIQIAGHYLQIMHLQPRMFCVTGVAVVAPIAACCLESQPRPMPPSIVCLACTRVHKRLNCYFSCVQPCTFWTLLTPVHVETW